MGSGEIEDPANQIVDTTTMDSRNIVVIGGPLSGKTTIAKALAKRLDLSDKMITLDKVVKYFLELPAYEPPANEEESDSRIVARVEIQNQIKLQMEGKAEPRKMAEPE